MLAGFSPAMSPPIPLPIPGIPGATPIFAKILALVSSASILRASSSIRLASSSGSTGGRSDLDSSFSSSGLGAGVGSFIDGMTGGWPLVGGRRVPRGPPARRMWVNLVALDVGTLAR